MSRVIGFSGACPIEIPLCEWLPQNVFSLSGVLFSLYDNHPRSTHRIANTLLFSYYLRSRSLSRGSLLAGPVQQKLNPTHNQTYINYFPV